MLIISEKQRYANLVGPSLINRCIRIIFITKLVLAKECEDTVHTQVPYRAY